MAFVGTTAVLNRATLMYSRALRGKIQGMNDTLMLAFWAAINIASSFIVASAGLRALVIIMCALVAVNIVQFAVLCVQRPDLVLPPPRTSLGPKGVQSKTPSPSDEDDLKASNSRPCTLGGVPSSKAQSPTDDDAVEIELGSSTAMEPERFQPSAPREVGLGVQQPVYAVSSV